MLANDWLWIVVQLVLGVCALVLLFVAYRASVQEFLAEGITAEGWGPLDRARLGVRIQPGRDNLGIAPGGQSGIAGIVLDYATRRWPWKWAFVFTGVALILTFVIIGSVMRGIPVDDAAGSSAQLQAAVDEMGTKFWISAVGVFESIFYQAVVAVLRGRLHDGIVTTLRESPFQIVDEFEWASRQIEEMRRLQELQVDVREAIGALYRDNKYAILLAEKQLGAIEELRRGSEEGTLAGLKEYRANGDAVRLAAASVRDEIATTRQLLADQVASVNGVANAQHATLQSLGSSQARWHESHIRIAQEQTEIAAGIYSGMQSIRDTTARSEQGIAAVGTSLESIDRSLQDGLEPVVKNVERVADAVLGPKLDELMAQLQNTLDSQLLKHMGPIREDLRNQGSDEVLRVIGEKMQAALTGGASEATRAFQETMASLSVSMPELLAGIQQAAASAERTNQEAKAQLAEAAVDSERRLSRLQEVVEHASDSLKTVMSAVESHSVSIVDSVSAQTREVVESVARQATASSEQVSLQLESMNDLLAGAHRDYAQAVAQAREAMTEDRRRWSDSLRDFSAELIATVGRLSIDRASAQSLADHLSTSAQELVVQRRAADEVVRTALVAADRARELLIGLQEHMRKESEVFERNRVQLEEIKDLRAELESSFGSVATSAGALLANQLREVNDQFEINARRLKGMAEEVHSRVGVPLVEAVEELHEVAKKLNQWQDGGRASASSVVPTRGR